jgi:hypothetical protein
MIHPGHPQDHLGHQDQDPKPHFHLHLKILAPMTGNMKPQLYSYCYASIHIYTTSRLKGLSL